MRAKAAKVTAATTIPVRDILDESISLLTSTTAVFIFGKSRAKSDSGFVSGQQELMGANLVPEVPA